MNPPSYSGAPSAIPSKQNPSSLAGGQLGRPLAHVFQHNNTQHLATVLDQAAAPSQQQQHHYHNSQQQQYNSQQQYHYSTQQQQQHNFSSQLRQQQQQQHIYTDQGLSQHQHRSSALLYSEWPDDFGHNKHHVPYPQSPNSSSSLLTPVSLQINHNNDSTLISPASTPLLSSLSTSTTAGSLTTAIPTVMSPELSSSQGSTSKRGASAPAEPPRPKKARRVIDEEEEEEEEETHDVVVGDEEEKEGEDEVVVEEVEEEGNEFLPPWMFDDDDDEPVEVLSASGKPKSLDEKRTDWMVKQLNKPEFFLILQAPKQGTPRTTPKSRIFQQLANGINSWYPSPNQVKYTMKQVKTKVETIKASFKRGQDLVHKSGFGTTNPSKTWKQQVLKTSPHYFKLEANWSVAWSDLVQDYCDSTSNLDDKVIDDSPTRVAIKAARRHEVKANGSEIEQMVGQGIDSDYSERDEDEDVLEARTMQELKQSGARAQKGKMAQKGKAAVKEKQAQKESPTTIYQRPSQRPLPKKSSTKAAPAGTLLQASNTTGGAQGSTSKAQVKDNYTHKYGGGGGSDKMQTLADSVRTSLESEKKNKEVELLIMKQRLAMEENEARERAEARRASLALEERRIDIEAQRIGIEAQRMNNDHILKMAQLQKEKVLEMYRMDLELRLGKGSTERPPPIKSQPSSPDRNTCQE
ncbi:hypothetical protein EC957_011047 [Mortierella hygrophila]|uniref:Uncharacterized protein n=1 Tax=Mortierella hygrophila TaxID=979708 RepID=A0A9P6EWB1_9FUNG|nr:hypothetical protein EC957_011047 [Mortierella hygrophila]